jgi:hypothetical protein
VSEVNLGFGSGRLPGAVCQGWNFLKLMTAAQRGPLEAFRSALVKVNMVRRRASKPRAAGVGITEADGRAS